MALLPVGIAAFIFIGEFGAQILIDERLNDLQVKTAKLMALTALVRNHAACAIISSEELRRVCRFLAA